MMNSPYAVFASAIELVHATPSPVADSNDDDVEQQRHNVSDNDSDYEL